MGRPKIAPEDKKTSKDYKTVHINVTPMQSEIINELGGPKKAFDTLYYFWFKNYSIYEEQELKEREVLKMVKRLGVTK